MEPRLQMMENKAVASAAQRAPSVDPHDNAASRARNGHEQQSCTKDDGATGLWQRAEYLEAGRRKTFASEHTSPSSTLPAAGSGCCRVRGTSAHEGRHQRSPRESSNVAGSGQNTPRSRTRQLGAEVRPQFLTSQCIHPTADDA